jgi:predicted RNA binding protein YcfA (HicA-like mRNA interferase family)
LPPRLGEVRKVLRANGFDCVRKRKHEIWLRRDEAGTVVARTVLSHGNAEVRTASLFAAILRQAKKTKEEFDRLP